ncbi:hypothetical protein ACQEVI_19760 [Promicromonospora sp. CA-289599]|uniref:hypothetical protein n=1 Tax=Promicromonospora sp. CA-289599 TaxID=3240014 RepID=UPI003D8BFBBE
MTTHDTPGAGASVPAPSMGAVLRVAAFVADLTGDNRVQGVNVYSLGHLYVTVPDPMQASDLADRLDLTGPTDVPATGDGEATGRGAHTYWEGSLDGVTVQVASDLRLGALPALRPWGWSAPADLQAVA